MDHTVFGECPRRIWIHAVETLPTGGDSVPEGVANRPDGERGMP